MRPIQGALLVALVTLSAFIHDVEGAVPVWTNPVGGAVVPINENAALNAEVVTFTATDADPPITYTLQNDGGGPFVINTGTDKLLVSPASLDFETTQSYVVVVRATDSTSPTPEVAEVTFTVSVIDVNDNNPVITATTVAATMDEEQTIGTIIPFVFTASDADDIDTLTYSLSGTDSSKFNIDANSGTITFKEVIDLDVAGTPSVYNLVLTVSDGTNSATQALTLTLTDINDEAPSCSPLIQYAPVNEGTSDTVNPLVTLACSDGDATSPNNDLLYTIVTGDTSKFGIPSNTVGEIFVNTAIDYETPTSSATLTIRVEDQGTSSALSTTVTVIVTIVPVNDNNPAWGTWIPAHTGNNYDLAEDVGIGKSVFTMVATDADLDTGGTIVYSFTSVTDGTNPANDVFSVDPNTGKVTTLKRLDRDSGITAYTLTCQATDGTTPITETVTVTLIDKNDNIPEFQNTPFAVRTKTETSAKTGSIITTVTALDGDATGTTLTYSVDAVISGSIAIGNYEFDAGVPGQLQFKNDIDLDTAGSTNIQVLRLLVKDGGTPELTGTATLTLSITDDNEHTPTITGVTPTGTISIAENVAVGTSVAQVAATDSDVRNEGVLTYSILSGNTGGAFTIDSAGLLKTGNTLDRETLDNYALVVKVADPTLSATVSISVTLTDVSDTRPTCSPSNIYVTVSETSTVNSAVATIACSDADSGDTLTYTATTHATNFGFTTPTNELKLISLTGFDYDSATQSYIVEVEADDGTNTATVTVFVTVGAENEGNPTFASNPTQNVAENTAPDPVYTQAATDTDFSPHNIVSYSIASVTNSGINLFRIQSTSGAISMISPADYEALPAGDKTYEIAVVAEDGGGQKATSTVTIVITDVNDNAPTCTSSTYTPNIDETPTGTAPFTVVTLGCTDPDGSPLTYTMVSQTPGTHFAVANDVVTLTASTLDYETATTHTLNIQVSDGTQTTDVDVYVTVNNLNDGGPTFPAQTPVSISENAVVGTSVADVIATDPDNNDPGFGDLQYSIISGDPSNQFVINVDTGLISTRKLLDYETTTTYSLTVQAIERGGANSATVVKVVNIADVNDNFPVCNPTTFAETVLENEAIAYEIKDFGCTDGDAGTTLTYTITTGDTSLFEMTGSKLVLKAQLDYETAQSHDLIITVSDGLAANNVLIQGTVTVGSVDEGQPAFPAAPTTPYTASVNEADPVGSAVVTVAATDPDSNLDSNGQVIYEFASSYPDFAIDRSTGQITIARALNRESAATQTLSVKASDATGFDTVSVVVTIVDANDNTPVFSPTSYTGTVAETDSAGVTVTTVTATDADDPGTNNYGTITYSLTGTGSSNFQISSTGVITTTAVLDADTGPSSYTLNAIATDGGGLAATALVVVTVTTDNQHDPVFAPAAYPITISENQFSVGDVIITTTATDADTGVDGQLTFAFVNPQTKFSLTQNGNTLGELRLQQPLDFDSGDTSFTIQIRATDSGSPARSAVTTVTITVDDVNDNTPLCASVVNADVSENQKSITTLSCTDADPGTTLTYSIVSTTPNTITPSVDASGVVSVAVDLDYEDSPSYTILIKVEDDGTPIKSVTVTTNLRLIDLNDNDPTLSGTFAFTVNEDDTASNTVLYTVAANSNDGATDTLTYSLDDTTYFDISSTGQITLKANAPDFETVGATYTMTVTVEDSANPTKRSASQLITVTVVDVNDNMPVFNPSVYTATIREDASVSDTLPTAVTATDADSTVAYNTVAYSILSGNTGGNWAIGPSTGVISVSSALDYETTSSYALVIQASDGTNVATVTYNIQVTGANEFAPVFSPASETVSVAEDAAIGDTVAVAAIPATDADSGVDGDITYTIDTGPLEIDANTGVVKVKTSLDRETTSSYTLKITATDKGTPPMSSTLDLTVNVNDINDNTPSCGSIYYGVISETATPSTSVATLVCQDDDDTSPNNLLTYSIATGGAGLFNIDTAGLVTVAAGATFDRETTASYTLVIDVVDQATGTKLTYNPQVLVTITDINDNDPAFSGLPTTVTKAENIAIGTTVTTVAATDADSGLNAEVVYSITAGNTGTVFFMEPDSGNILLNNALDYETTQSYVLTVMATDKGVPSRSGSAQLTVSVTDVSDVAPVCGTSLYRGTVTENAVSESVLTVACTDADAIDTITYSITAGDTNSDFVIDPSSGAITTAAGASIDFETTPEFTLTVQASDGSLTDTTQVKVVVTDVNEHDPAFTSSGVYTASVAENEVAGYSVITVAATDADTAETSLTFSITGGNTGNVFGIDSVTGEVYVVSPLDRETTSSYILNLQVEDSGGKTGAGTLTITITDINDNAPTCTSYTLVADVDENAAAVLSPPSCSDVDTVASPSLAYSIVSGAHASLTINSGTGAVSVISPGFDYETTTSHVVVIEVSDQDTPTPKTAQVTLTINVNPVNEATPAFTPSNTYTPAAVSEDTVAGTSVAQVAATDTDDTEDGTVRYSIVSGDPQSQFSIDENSGIIKVAKSLDRETTASYTLTVRATDDAPGAATALSADATVTITISDINDNLPVFNPTIYTEDVLESATPGPTAVILTVTVTDADDGANGVVTVAITSGNAEDKFEMSGSDLVLKNALDYETTQSYVLTLEATDGGTPSLTSLAQVTINVLPFNEVAPQMSASTASASIPESTVLGTLVYDADATDTDLTAHGDITYSIQSPSPLNEFILDPNDGKLYVGSQLDYDTPPTTYNIVIKATDGGGQSASTSTVALTVTLTDENDNYPQFTNSLTTFDIDENVVTGTVVGTVPVTDADTGVNGQLTYTKLSGNGFSLFNIDSASGQITTAGTIDYETSQVYYLTVRASDGGTPSLSSTGLVKIDINNMNDNDPVIIPTVIAVDLSEDAVVGTSVLDMAGTDADTAINGFSMAVADSYFQVSSTGEITTKAVLDRETIATHVIYIRLLDLPTSADATVRTVTGTVTINLIDVNDNDPIISGTYSQTVSEDATLNSQVYQIIATDADAGANGQLDYAITAGNTGNAFSIDSFGNVKVNAALDRETTASYSLTITATDRGTPARSDQVVATVIISDVNDNDPVPNPATYTFSVIENSNAATAVGTITATDADAGANAALVYSLDSFSQGDMAHFTIDGATGAITVASSNTLDRETQDTYVGKVKITDSGSPLARTATADVTINIQDANDNAPVFTGDPYTGSVGEDAAVSTSVIQVAATDADIGANAAITFSLDNTLLDGAAADADFQIDGSTGWITVKSTLDYETRTTYTFIVVATDGGSPALSSTATVTINVNDINDNRPIFTQLFYNKEVSITGLCTWQVVQVTATDADSGVNAQVSYTFVSNALDHIFSLDSSTGVMSLGAVVASGQRYVQEIQATDGGTPALTSATPTTVRVDTFHPGDVLITFTLSISKADFEAQQATFMANLQAVVRNTYPSAIVRLWCVEEYAGTAQTPGSARRRLLANPVNVHTYALQTDTTESQANINTDKAFVSQGDFLSLVAANAEGDPGAAIQGTDWDYYNIISVNAYNGKTESWWDTTYGPIITAIAAAFGLVWFCLLTYMIVRGCCMRKVSPEGRRRKAKVRLTEVAPVTPENQQKKAPIVDTKNYNANKGTVPDPLHQPAKATFPPIITTNPSPEKKLNNSNTPPSRETTRTPRNILLTPNNDYNIVNRQFDGKVYDPATGRMYAYNTKTWQREWLD